MPVEQKCPKCGCKQVMLLVEPRKLRRSKRVSLEDYTCSNPKCLYVGSYEEFTFIMPDKEIEK